MKIYLSADIEGITGTTHWDETDKNKADYSEFRDQMTAEVAAACEGALAAGATEVWVKDAHDQARNIVAAKLPQATQLLRGWSGHPLMMMQELDASFGAVLLIGYHARGGSADSPLAHTMSSKLAYLKINGLPGSEFLLSAYAAAQVGVPVALVTGDAGLCAEVQALNSHIRTVAVKSGIGDSTINIHPTVAVERIRTAAQQALTGDLPLCRLALPAHFVVEAGFHKHTQAYSASFYPGARLVDKHTLQFEADDYLDVLRLVMFAF